MTECCEKHNIMKNWILHLKNNSGSPAVMKHQGTIPLAFNFKPLNRKDHEERV